MLDQQWLVFAGDLFPNAIGVGLNAAKAARQKARAQKACEAEQRQERSAQAAEQRKKKLLVRSVEVA